jgi:thiosulfate dehydrogenase
LKSNWFPCILCIALVALLFGRSFKTADPLLQPDFKMFDESALWQPPLTPIPADTEGDLIRYGKDLIEHTATFLGPRGIIRSMSNGMNCQNCHIKAGSVAYGNPFAAVASTYPRFRERSGINESIEFRVNDCLQRSLNGSTLDSLSTEMRAIVAYLKWIGDGVPSGFIPKGAGVKELPFLQRAANPSNGKQVFQTHCQRCHGANGEGQMADNAAEYTYPPLWGEHSFNNGAGLLRLSRLAGFIYNNMPYGTTWEQPVLTPEQAWDVAAYISSQPRPKKNFSGDWPNISRKPADFPSGPYADNFPEQQHRYGPFLPIIQAKKIASATR